MKYIPVTFSPWRATLYIPIFFAVLFLVACGNVGEKYVPTTVAETPAQHVYALKVKHKAMLELVVQYTTLPRCAVTESFVCSKESVVRIMEKAHRGADSALDESEKIVRDPAVTESTANLAVESARSAVAVLTNILAENGILQ